MGPHAETALEQRHPPASHGSQRADSAAVAFHLHRTRSRFVVSKVPTLRELVPHATFRMLDFESPPGWSRFNPTVAAAGVGFNIIVRTANYIHLGRGGRGGLGYLFADGGKRVFTRNYLLTVDDDLRVQTVQALVDQSLGPRKFPSWAVGYEDCRLVHSSEQALVICTVCDRNAAQRPEVAMLQLAGNAVTRVTVLRGPDPARAEKNWMPFIRGDALHLVYACAPTTVFACDATSGRLSLVSKQAAPREASAFRGGSQGISFEGGILFVVHEAPVVGPYSHRFVLIDKEGTLAAFSQPFSFLGAQVEFCAGLAPKEQALVLTFGMADHTAWIAIVDVEECVRLLEPC